MTKTLRVYESDWEYLSRKAIDNRTSIMSEVRRLVDNDKAEGNEE